MPREEGKIPVRNLVFRCLIAGVNQDIVPPIPFVLIIFLFSQLIDESQKKMKTKLKGSYPPPDYSAVAGSQPLPKVCCTLLCALLPHSHDADQNFAGRKSWFATVNTILLLQTLSVMISRFFMSRSCERKSKSCRFQTPSISRKQILSHVTLLHL